MKIPVSRVETWLPIPGFSGYEASSWGRLRSYRSPNGRGGLVSTPRLLVQSPVPGKPYSQVTLSLGTGRYKQVRVHYLIALTFKGPRPSPLYEVCHNDGNGTNNRETNLRWDTKKANAADQLKHGTKPVGSQSNLAKLTDAQVLEIKAAIPNWKHGMGVEFAERFGVGTTAISNIKREKRWAHL